MAAAGIMRAKVIRVRKAINRAAGPGAAADLPRWIRKSGGRSPAGAAVPLRNRKAAEVMDDMNKKNRDMTGKIGATNARVMVADATWGEAAKVMSHPALRNATNTGSFRGAGTAVTTKAKEDAVVIPHPSPRDEAVGIGKMRMKITAAAEDGSRKMKAVVRAAVSREWIPSNAESSRDAAAMPHRTTNLATSTGGLKVLVKGNMKAVVGTNEEAAVGGVARAVDLRGWMKNKGMRSPFAAAEPRRVLRNATNTENSPATAAEEVAAGGAGKAAQHETANN